MSKIIVNHNIKSTSSLEVVKDKKGILKDNIITYNHDGAMIKLKLLENKIFFERENKDVKIYLEFEKTKYIIKDLKIEIKLETKTKNIIINDNNLMIEYDLFMNGEFSDSFKYELEWSDL